MSLPDWREEAITTRGAPSDIQRTDSFAGGERFKVVRQRGSVRYYGKVGWPRLVRIDYHGAKQVRTGTCHAMLKAAGIPQP